MDYKMDRLIRFLIKNNVNAWLVLLDSNNIKHYDKMKTAITVLDKNQLVHFAVMCAKSVHYIYEQKNPKDKNIVNLLNYLSEIKDFKNLSQEQKREIDRLDTITFSIACDNIGAYAAVANCAHAAANAALNPNDAFAYVLNAAAGSVKAANAFDSVNSAKNKKMQEDLTLQLLKKVLLTQESNGNIP